MGYSSGMFWRFMPAADSSVDRFVVRDVDSRLNARDRIAVEEWIESKLPVHILRDHVNHCIVMNGGMWGAVKDSLPNMKELIMAWSRYQNRTICHIITFPTIHTNSATLVFKPIISLLRSPTFSFSFTLLTYSPSHDHQYSVATNTWQIYTFWNPKYGQKSKINRFPTMRTVVIVIPTPNHFLPDDTKTINMLVKCLIVKIIHV